MLSKISLVTLILFLVPSLASAGMIYASTPTTSPVRGSISPAGYVSASSPVTFTVTALPGNMIGAVTLNGKQLLPSAPGKYVVPLSATTQKILASFVAEAPSQLTAVLPTTLLAKPGSPLNVYAGSSTVILPSGSVATYTWSVSPGATVTPPTGATAASSGLVTTFTSATPGAYTLSLRLSAPGTGLADSSASATVVVQSQTMVNSKVCTDCHQSAPYAAYIMSRHAASNSGPACQDCHNPGLALPHPGIQPTNATCTACHGSVSGHAAAANVCNQCHDPHSASSTHVPAASRPDCATCHDTKALAAPHYGGTAFIEAQYVSDASLPVSCSSCHGGLVNAAANRAILAQYTSSAHGSPLAEAWRHYDWRSSTRAACQRCHAGTAFVAKLGNENSTANAYQPTDVLKPGEVLNCSACHTDAGTGALRTAARQFTINLSNGATVTYDVAGASTLCARCHSGRETGNSIKADADADGIRGFIDSHYLVAAATVYNKGGYEYAGQDYASLGSHKNVGAGSQGPCVACHMGIGTANHTWNVANSNTCGNCHSNPTAAKLAEAKAGYDVALDSLRLALEAKGIYYDASHPYFFTAPYDPNKAVYDPANPTAANTPFTNWAGVYGLSSWKDVMGAAFNYRMLVNDPGAYAHNKQYALKLIADSCDFLADSAVDGQGIPAAVTTAIKSVKFGLK